MKINVKRLIVTICFLEFSFLILTQIKKSYPDTREYKDHRLFSDEFARGPRS